MSQLSLKQLLIEIRQCNACCDLPLGPRPIVAAAESAQILLIGQAPGIRVHESGIPWDDPSGKRLRQWLGVHNQQFYDPGLFAIVPMGFCFPGQGKSGDLPPRPQCAELWHQKLVGRLPSVRLTLLLGQYAQRYVLGDRGRRTLTETVRNWRQYAPTMVPLPHPSPRNNRWLKKNDWFETELLPWLKKQTQQVVAKQAGDIAFDSGV